MPLRHHCCTQKELLDTMEEQFWLVQRKYNISPGDFPEISDFKYVWPDAETATCRRQPLHTRVTR